MTLETLPSVAEKLVASLEAYNTKPTKAESKRIRMLLGDIKNSTPALRSALVDADKSGEY